MVREIIRGKYCGFCTGVTRAVETARRAAGKHGSVYTLGPIIHNPQAVEKLAESNIIPVDDIKGLEETDTVLIRSHGITAEFEAEIRCRGFNLVDATCPKVKRAQRICSGLGEEFSRVIIIGLPEHPEVKGIVSRAGGKAVVISSLGEAAALDEFPDAGVLVQTTFRVEKFYSIVSELLKKSRVLKIHNTICEETLSRQSEVREIARKVDILYVAGGRNSSNTKRLYEAVSGRVEAYCIEVPDEISPDRLTGKKRIGIVAGASTPIGTVDSIENKIREEVNKNKEGK